VAPQGQAVGDLLGHQDDDRDADEDGAPHEIDGRHFRAGKFRNHNIGLCLC